MEKSLPKKVETEIVVKFLNETLDHKLGEFGAQLDKKFETFERKIDEKFDQKFGELAQQMNTIGSLIKNTHQEVKHFIELHKILDQKVSELEQRVARLEQLVRA